MRPLHPCEREEPAVGIDDRRSDVHTELARPVVAGTDHSLRDLTGERHCSPLVVRVPDAGMLPGRSLGRCPISAAVVTPTHRAVRATTPTLTEGADESTE